MRIFCTFNLVRIYLQWRLENHYKKYSKEQLSKDLQSYFKSVASTTENYQNGKAVSFNTGTLRMLKLPRPCSVTSSDSSLFVKACRWKRMGGATKVSENQPSKSPRTFLWRPTLVWWQRKVSQTFLVSIRMLFYPLLLHLQLRV